MMPRSTRTLFHSDCLLVLAILWVLFSMGSAAAQQTATPQPTMNDLARNAQLRVAKIYGAGGGNGLEEYQSGFLVSPFGHVATAWSYVLDVEPVVILDDGRRFEAKIIGFQPGLELAVLKIDVDDVPYFDLRQNDLPVAQIGDPVLAVSNLFGVATGNEPASVMQGSIASLTQLDAGRGSLKTPYRGQVIVLDLVANNPGAAGGALVDIDGKLVGMLGKELRDLQTGVWLNYAVPTSVIRKAITDMIAGRETTVPDESNPILPREKSHSVRTLGFVMVPDVLEKTPAYVDQVIPDSPAASMVLRPDDLLLLVEGQRVESQAALRELLRRIDRRDDVQVTVQRGTEIVPVTLRARDMQHNLTESTMLRIQP